MKQRGSAIVISMLLISAISLIAFGLAKAMYANTGTVTLYEDGSVAYFAAESGLEEGFLRYRYNQNTEIPFDDWKLGEDKVFKTTLGNSAGATLLGTRSGLTASDYSGIAPATDIEKTNQAYDLRIGYLGTEGHPFFGVPASDGTLASDASTLSDGTYGSAYVARDESIKIDLTGLKLDSDNTNNLKMKVQFYGTSSQEDMCKALIEIKFTVTDLSGATHEYTDLVKPIASGVGASQNCDTLINGSGINVYRTISATGVSTSLWPNQSISYNVDRLQSVFERALVTLPTENSKVMLTLRPLFFNARIGLIIAKCDGVGNTSCYTKSNVVAGPFTTVDSTGYFGSVVKKLSANIDRQSGTLYDLFDYVINKKS